MDDPSYETLMHAWIDAVPNTYQPYLARAKYYYHMGWASRGTKWASETKKEQFEQMTVYFAKAVQDIGSSLDLNSQSMVAYCLAIDMANVLGRDVDAELVARKALEINPISYKVRAYYLGSLVPRWGGSYELMEVFVDASMAYVSKNPKLVLLKGFIPRDKADLEAISGRYSVADKLYCQALIFGENHLTNKDRLCNE